MLKQVKLVCHLNRNVLFTHTKRGQKNYIRFSSYFSRIDQNPPRTEHNKYQQYRNYTIICAATGIGAYLLYNYYYKSRFKFQTVSAYENQSTIHCGEYKKGLPTYTAEQVSKHDSKDKGIWISFREGVYDITEFVEKHPGGPGKIMMGAGGSIEPFWKIFANHNQPEIYALLESMRIGNLSMQDVIKQTGDDHNPYSNEPLRHKVLKINGHKPFCAEPPAPMLVESYLTPKELFYVRNHLPVPEIDLKDYTLDIAIEDDVKTSLTFNDLKNFPKSTITSAIMCGGNRRSEMAAVKSLRGLSWGVAAIGNAKWTGVKLCDILNQLGIKESDYSHVQFEGLDMDPSGTQYAASIPISKAMDPRADVLIAYEMNDEPISRDHGFPVRVVVPGVVGARSVKWLGKITLSKHECPSQWQQGDYKGFPPSVDWDTVDFKKSPAIQEMPVTSAICVPQPNEKVVRKDGKIQTKGYAWSGGGRKIIRVDVTADKGKTWHVANLVAEDEEAKEGRHWGWTLWEADIPVNKTNEEIEIWAKAVDASYNVQPESFENIWNLRGLLCNAYHRVKVTISK